MRAGCLCVLFTTVPPACASFIVGATEIFVKWMNKCLYL